MKTIIRTPNWLGDAVMSLPALSVINASKDELALLTLKKLEPFYSIAMPGVDVLTMKRSGFLSNAGVAGRIRARGCKRGILFTDSFSSALLMRFAGTEERVGYENESRGFLLTKPLKKEGGGRKKHLAKEYLELAAACGYGGKAQSPFKELRRWRMKNSRSTDRLSRLGAMGVVLAPGAAYGPAKRWPLRNFIELGQRLARQRRARLIVTGSREEAPLAQRVAKEIGSRAVSVAGETGLEDLMRVLAHSRLVVCNDSGTMHLAAALGCRVLAIFGSSDPKWTAPLGKKAKVLRRAYDCSPCYRRKCDRRYVCLTSISVDDVMDAIGEMLGK